MKAIQISMIIDEVCKQLGIDYQSKNPHYYEEDKKIPKLPSPLKKEEK